MGACKRKTHGEEMRRELEKTAGGHLWYGRTASAGDTAVKQSRRRLE